MLLTNCRIIFNSPLSALFNRRRIDPYAFSRLPADLLCTGNPGCLALLSFILPVMFVSFPKPEQVFYYVFRLSHPGAFYKGFFRKMSIGIPIIESICRRGANSTYILGTIAIISICCAYIVPLLFRLRNFSQMMFRFKTQRICNF